MSFSFNFELTEEESCNSHNAFSAKDENHKNKDQQLIVNSEEPAFEVKSFYDDTIISKIETHTLIFNDHLLAIVDTSKLESLITNDTEFRTAVCNSSSLSEIVSHSDLVEGVYEGGLKVWECGVDLAKFLSSNVLDTTIEINGKNVLEVGCGAGLPGLYCVKCGAKCVDFQDYNVEVLKLMTHTNVQNNIDDDEEDDSQLKSVCRYFAGDWEAFCEITDNDTKYDLILSAETIYNVENYPKLHKVFDQMLAADGVILIAAKVYYFGVGGSVDTFLEYVNAQNCFESETVWETKSGVPRKILMLKRQSRKT